MLPSGRSQSDWCQTEGPIAQSLLARSYTRYSSTSFTNSSCHPLCMRYYASQLLVIRICTPSRANTSRTRLNETPVPLDLPYPMDKRPRLVLVSKSRLAQTPGLSPVCCPTSPAAFVALAPSFAVRTEIIRLSPPLEVASLCNASSTEVTRSNPSFLHLLSYGTTQPAASGRRDFLGPAFSSRRGTRRHR